MDLPQSRVHLVWIGAELPWFARLAVESAVVAMPSARVTLHSVVEHPGGRHLRALARHERFEHRTWSLRSVFDGCAVDADDCVRLVARTGRGAAAVSNLVRLALLDRFGGVYLDTDTIVVAPLDDPDRTGAYVGTELVWASNRRRVDGALRTGDVLATVPWAVSRGVHAADARIAAGRLGLADRWRPGLRPQVNNAVIGAPAGSAFVAEALRRALVVPDPSARFALGPSLLDDVARDRPDTVVRLDDRRFYAIPPGQSRRWFDDVTVELPDEAQVVHYVASNHGPLLASIETDPRLRSHPAVFWREARRVRAAAERLATRPRSTHPAAADGAVVGATR